MKTILLLITLGCLHFTSMASDQIRDVQAALKSQGFYYGEVSGADNAETGAAIRRFQIRKGIAVTGKLNAETVSALGVGSNAPQPAGTPPPAAKGAQAEGAKQFNPPPPSGNAKQPRVTQAPAVSAEKPDPALAAGSDGSLSVRRTRNDDAAIVDPPSPVPPAVSTPLNSLFRGTAYAGAAREVQESTLRSAQAILAGRRYYRGPLDGRAGPATTEAIFMYQEDTELRRTGRLDTETLAAMNLLPDRRTDAPALKRFYNPNRRRDTSVRWGIWPW